MFSARFYNTTADITQNSRYYVIHHSKTTNFFLNALISKIDKNKIHLNVSAVTCWSAIIPADGWQSEGCPYQGGCEQAKCWRYCGQSSSSGVKCYTSERYGNQRYCEQDRDCDTCAICFSPCSSCTTTLGPPSTVSAPYCSSPSTKKP